MANPNQPIWRAESDDDEDPDGHSEEGFFGPFEEEYFGEAVEEPEETEEAPSFISLDRIIGVEQPAEEEPVAEEVEGDALVEEEPPTVEEGMEGGDLNIPHEEAVESEEPGAQGEQASAETTEVDEPSSEPVPAETQSESEERVEEPAEEEPVEESEENPIAEETSLVEEEPQIEESGTEDELEPAEEPEQAVADQLEEAPDVDPVGEESSESTDSTLAPEELEIPLEEVEDDTETISDTEAKDKEEPGQDSAETTPEAEEPEDPIEAIVTNEEAPDEVLEEMLREEQAAAHTEALEQAGIEAEAEDIVKKSEYQAPVDEKGREADVNTVGPAIAVGLLVNYLSKRRDKKLGREVKKTNKELADLKKDAEEKLASEIRKSQDQQEYHTAEEINKLKAEESPQPAVETNKDQEDTVEDDGQLIVEHAEVTQASPQAEIGADTNDEEAIEQALDEEVSVQANQELSGSSVEDPSLEREGVQVETLARQNELNQEEPGSAPEAAFEKSQERSTQPTGKILSGEEPVYSSQDLTPISDILANREDQITELSGTNERLNQDLSDHISDQDVHTRNYASSVRAGFAAGLIIVCLLIVYLFFR